MGAIVSSPRLKVRFTEPSVVATEIPGRLGLMLKGGSLSIISGKRPEDPKTAEEGEIILSGRVAQINFGEIDIGKFNAVLTINTELFKDGMVFAPVMLVPGKQEIVITIHARKQMAIREYSHLLTLFLLD